MDDLVQFLRNRLSDDEQAAKAAASELGADWYYSDGSVLARREDDMVATGSQSFMERERGEHIARHDPARVLREVDAKRRILNDVLPTMQADELRIAGEWGVGSDPVREASDDLLSLLAPPYADHPDYRSEWTA
jgi:hypothetical protein